MDEGQFRIKYFENEKSAMCNWWICDKNVPIASAPTKDAMRAFSPLLSSAPSPITA